MGVAYVIMIIVYSVIVHKATLDGAQDVPPVDSNSAYYEKALNADYPEF